MIETSYSSSVGSAMAMEGNINPGMPTGLRTYAAIEPIEKSIKWASHTTLTLQQPNSSGEKNERGQAW